MTGLLGEAERIFDTEFDSLPAVEPRPRAGSPHTWRVDLDVASRDEPPATPPQSLALWFDTGDPYRGLPRACNVVRQVLGANPFCTLQIVLRTGSPFPFDVFDSLRAACQRPENIYLDRYYAFMPGRRDAARRIAVVAPEAALGNFDSDWLAAADEHCEFIVEPAVEAIDGSRE
jgi:hypothetical protein